MFDQRRKVLNFYLIFFKLLLLGNSLKFSNLFHTLGQTLLFRFRFTELIEAILLKKCLNFIILLFCSLSGELDDFVLSKKVFAVLLHFLLVVCVMFFEELLALYFTLLLV
jgi:hypothetical protein